MGLFQNVKSEIVGRETALLAVGTGVRENVESTGRGDKKTEV